MKKILFFAVLNFGLQSNFCYPQQNQIDSISNLIKKDNEDTSKVNHLNDLSWLLIFQNPDTAIILSKQALKIITPVSSIEFPVTKNGMEDKQVKRIRASMNSTLGTCYYFKADFSIAIEYYLKALKIDEEISNKKGIAADMGNVGMVYFNQSNYTKALEYYLKALK